MRNNTNPNQIALFDPVEDRGIVDVRKSGGGGEIYRSINIYNNIISVENLLVAWREFLHGKRSRKDVAQFSVHLTDNILALHRELVDKTYHHGPYKAFRINDPKPRDIHKASVRDSSYLFTRIRYL
jgi:hypothetical protein